MSIRLHNICKPASYAGAPGPLFDGLDLEVEEGTRVGILGAAKSGKSTLLRLICGTEIPDGGRVEVTSRVSWPLPMNTFLAATSTVIVNIRFMARLYGIRDEAFPRRIADMVEISDFLNVPLHKCPKFVKPRLALAIGIGMEFDIYLFDGVFAAADKEFKKKATEIVAERMATRGYVLATSLPAEVERNCDSAYVLEAGRARYFAQAKEGVEYFKELLAAQKQKQDAGGEDPIRPGEDEGEDEAGDIEILGTAIGSAIE